MSGENNPNGLTEEKLERCLHQLHERAAGTIGEMLHFEIGECVSGSGDYTLYACTEPWMRNAFGTLHGGIISTGLDQGMGMVAACLVDGQAITPTIQMNVTFHHFLMAGEQMCLKIHVEALTRTMIHLRAEVFAQQNSGRLCASATGIFFIKGLQ